jgi:hypothetical protein
MLDRYGKESPVLFDLRDWYVAECEKFGQSLLGKRPGVWGSFDNGEPITREHRLLYRDRLDLHAAFPNPYATDDVSNSYFHWFAANGRRAIIRKDKPEPAFMAILRRHAHKPPLKWAKTAWKSMRAPA